jgi:CHAD domain-containing protein
MARKPFPAKAGEKRLGRFLSALRAAARHPEDEAIHDLRVAIRRLLAFLDVASTLADANRPVPLEPTVTLRRLMKPLGRLRDAHVKMLHIRTLAPLADPVTWRYALAIASDVDRWERAVARTLARTSPRDIRKNFRFLPPSPLSPGEIRGMAIALLGKREAEVARLSERLLEARSPMALHELRLAFKAYRYTAEALSDLLPGLTAETESRLHDFQTLLGDIHDFDVMLEDFRLFRGKVLGIPTAGNDIEDNLEAGRDSKWREALSFLQAGEGIRALFARR